MTQFVGKEVSDLTTEGISPRRELADITAEQGLTHGRQLSGREFYSFSKNIQDAAWDLDKLKTSDEVAEFFRENGIQGKRGLLESCLIANWAIGCGIDDVQVDNTGLNFRLNGLPYRFASDAIREFVVRFDNGDFPFLEAE